MKLSSLLNEIKVSDQETEEVTPEMVYPLFLKVRNQISDKKTNELKKKYGWKDNYYKDNETWIYSIHPEYLDRFYKELMGLENNVKEIKSTPNVTLEMVIKEFKKAFPNYMFIHNPSVESEVGKIVNKYYLNKEKKINPIEQIKTLDPKKLKALYDDLKKRNNELKEAQTTPAVNPEFVINYIGELIQYSPREDKIFWKHFQELNDTLSRYGVDVLAYEDQVKKMRSNELSDLMSRLTKFRAKYDKLAEIKQRVPIRGLDRKKIYDLYLEILFQLREKNKDYILPRIATKLGWKEYEYGTVGIWIGHGLQQKDFPVFYQALLAIKNKYDLKEIKSSPKLNITRQQVLDEWDKCLDKTHSFEGYAKLSEIRKIYGFEYNKNNPNQNFREFIMKGIPEEELPKLYRLIREVYPDLKEAPEDFQNYLDNPDFKKDYSNEQKIQQIIKTIQDRVENKQWTKYSDGSYTMKIGDLYVKYYPENSLGLLMATAAAGYKPEASYVPSERVLNIYGRVNPNELRHELVHYMDSKVIGGKAMAASSRARNAQLATVGTAAHSPEQMQIYYNAPEEFNAHWFEFIMPQVNQLFDNGNMPSLEQFTQSIDSNPQVKNFYNHLNDQNKNRFNRRLGIYYQAMQQGRPEVDNGQIEDPGFVGKLKNLFTRRAA